MAHYIKLLIFVITTTTGSSLSQIVTTTLGDVAGNRVSINGAMVVDEYLGVPYAEPPVRERRFARPQPKLPWPNGFTLSATNFGSACPQFATSLPDGIAMSEDCLFLNIIVPANAVADHGPLPVMLFIPGQGFRLNAGSEYIGREMALNGSVIVVTINYRIGIFGYFSTGDDCSPGNYGLWDQRLAIEWVRDNIAAFGGDSNRTTIVGQGREGATAVSSQILSPVNDHQLFQRAIMQSGIFDYTSYLMTEETAERLSESTANSLQCNERTWPQKVACLRNKSWQEIQHVSNPFDQFQPRIDGNFFPEPFAKLIEKDHIQQYDVIVGINSDEGLSILATALPLADFINVGNVQGFVMNSITGTDVDDYRANVITKSIEQRYIDPATGLLASDKDALRYILNITGDGQFIARSIRLLRYHQRSRTSNTFMYYFDYLDNNYVFFPADVRNGLAAGHGEELFYLWDTVSGRDTAISAPVGSTSRDIRSDMIRYWTNFAHTGDPNDGPSETSSAVMWSQFDSSNETYLWIKGDTALGQHLRAEYVNLWQDFIPTVIGDGDDTMSCSVEAPTPNTLSNPEDAIIEGDVDIQLDVVDSDGVRLGGLRGVTRRADAGVGGRRIRVFRGVPYAPPPVGERRFTHSELLVDWGNVTFLNATEAPPACPQTGFAPLSLLQPNTFSEDCLYLNVFAPVLDETNTDPLPVIVYLHFGLFQTGSGTVLDASSLSSYTNALVVTVNYRLGAFGFLSTGDDASPGNYGITDVVTVLKWIKKYIGSFGGDPGSVTTLGIGAGGHLAQLISLNGLNNGLFHRIIVLGDPVLSPVNIKSTANDPLQHALKLAANLDCPMSNTKNIVACLRKKSTEEIIRASIGPTSIGALPFYPVLDGSVLKAPSNEILASGNFEAIPILMGALEVDSITLSQVFLGFNDTCPDDKHASLIIRHIVRAFYDAEMQDELVLLFELFYLRSEFAPSSSAASTECRIGHQLSELLTDLIVRIPFMEAARLIAQTGIDTYIYTFAFRPENHFYQVFDFPSWVELTFGDDIPYAFGWPYDQRVTEQTGMCFGPIDRKVSINFMEMIASFAKTGVPSANPSDPTSLWQPYDPSAHNSLFLDGPCPRQRPIPRATEKDKFWNSVIAGLNDGSTSVTTTEYTSSCTVTTFFDFSLSAVSAGRAIGGMIVAIAVLAGLLFFILLMKCCLVLSEIKKSSAYKV